VAKAKAIIKRRKAVVNTRKITKTMELVSTAKYKQSFNRVASARPYRRTLEDVMRDLAASGGDVEHPLLERREPPKHVTLLLLTSNRGLAGGFNSNLIRMARAYADDQQAAGVEVAFHVTGKKGITALRHARWALAGEYVHFGDRPQYADIEKLAGEFMAAYESARTDRVVVVYQKYHSAAVQRPNLLALLPLERAAEGVASRPSQYLYSPDAASILKSLLPAYFRTALYHAFLENVVGEQRARMVAMKNATDNAESMIKSLTRAYNRARQSQITNEIAELMGGVEALK
jgi:F-type H+-transporting ATPase subunit gamma